MQEVKTTVTEMKSVSDRFISRLDMTEERLSEFEIVPGSSPGWSRVFEGETARRPIQMLIRDNKEE